MVGFGSSWWYEVARGTAAGIYGGHGISLSRQLARMNAAVAEWY